MPTTDSNEELRLEIWSVLCAVNVHLGIDCSFKSPCESCDWALGKIMASLKNKGEGIMNIYKPSEQLYYVVELDGDTWFAHYNNFTNVQESDEVAFGETPQQALQNFINKRVELNG